MTVPLRTVLEPDFSLTAIREEWAQLASFRWTPPDGADYSARMSVTATVDEGTVGQVRFRAVGAGAATPITFSTPGSENELAEWLNLGFGERTIVVEGRRVMGLGALRILRVAGTADLTSEVPVIGAPVPGTAHAALGPLVAEAVGSFGFPEAAGDGNLLTPDDSSYEASTGAWTATNGTLAWVADPAAPHGGFMLQVTAVADGDVTLSLPVDLPVEGGGTYTLYGTDRATGPLREVLYEVDVFDADGVLIAVLGGVNVEQSDVVEPPVEEPVFAVAEAADAAGSGATPVGATVSGVEHLTVVPSEGVAAVEVMVDGVLLARSDQAPFVVPWDTTVAGNGPVTLTARVEYRLAGSDLVDLRVQEATAVVEVANEVVAPDPVFELARSATSAGSSPTRIVPDSSLSGTVHVTTWPPSSEVTSVVFSLDGVVQVTDSVSPFVWSWDTLTAADGGHELSAVVSYGAGKQQSLSVPVTVANGTPLGGNTSSFATVVGVNTAGSDAPQKVANFEADLRRPAGSMGASVRFLRKASGWSQYNFGVQLDEYGRTGRPIGMLLQGFWGQAEWGNRDGYVDDIVDSSPNKVRIPLVAKTHDGQTSSLGFTRIRQTQLGTGMRIDIRNVGTGVVLAGNREIVGVSRTSGYLEITYSGASVSPTGAHGVFLAGVNTMSAMANGEYNGHYTTIGNRLMATLGDNRPVCTAVMHECNGDWYGHSAAGSTNRHAAFKNAFRQLVETMNPVLSGNYWWDFNTSTGTKYAGFDLLYPGDDVVHHMSQNFYNRGVSHSLLGMARWQNFRDMPHGLDALRDFAVVRDKRITFHEWAVDSKNPNSDPDDEVYVREFSAWLKRLGSRIAGHWYFNINEQGGGTEGYGTRHTIYPRSSFTSGGKTYPFPFPQSAAAFLAAWRV